ncbi:hypothetical protein FNV43_RR07357 [Rhamnella rubrinervis]|uniref:Uncharacterized protein n=1 Tax=Rhamnella rubrinervis TaxID=2594499 RepID=A0A8K0HEM5_9ROSA|nr:hypothetical protein FNV43_RR07357 [Rhamnella rubrinervis]
MRYGRPIDMPIFLHFFYLKPNEEGIYAFYAHLHIRLLEDALTSDKGWKERYFFIKREGLFDPVGTFDFGIRFVWLKRLLYGEPTDPLWALYLAVDMGKMKLRVVEKELQKKAACKASGSTPNQDLEPSQGGSPGLPVPFEAVIKADNAWKKKATALNNLAAINKKLEEEVQRLKQIAAGTISKTEQLENNWFEANLKLTEKDEELRNLRLDFSRLASERDELQAQATV